jgi:hypothetical protein
VQDIHTLDDHKIIRTETVHGGLIMKGILIYGLLLYASVLMGYVTAEEKSVQPPKRLVVYPDLDTLWGTTLTQRGPQSKWNDSTLANAFHMAKQAGIGVAVWSLQWGLIEKKPEKYEWGLADYMIAKTKEQGLKASLSIELLLGPNKGAYPKGLQGKKFDDSEFANSFKTFVRKLAQRYKGKLDYLWIGNEIEGYFTKHSREKAGFLKLVADARKEVKSVAPGIIVGGVGSYHQARAYKETKLLKDLADRSDVIAMTLYVEDDPEDPGTADAESYFQSLFELIPDKKIVIHETSWSSKGKKGSELRQEEYIKELARVRKKYRDRFEFISWFALHDLAEEDSRFAAKVYGIGGINDFLKWLGSLGLLTNKGVEKPAWRAWMKYVVEGK